MICRVCAAPMVQDALVAADARRFIDPGLPVPVVMKCRNGHSERIDPALTVAAPTARLVTPRCAVCGVELPTERKGAVPRKSCGPEHRRFIERMRAAAQAEHVRRHKSWRADAPFVPFRFNLEAQPWYRGAATAFRPVAPPRPVRLRSGPEFPPIPAAWLEGFRRLYPELDEPAVPFPVPE